jgi:O-antigen ligase
MTGLAIGATVHGFPLAAEKAGVIVAALLAAAAVLARAPRISQRRRAAAVLAALIVTPTLLAVDVWHTSQATHLRHQPAKAAAAAVLALAVLAGLAVLIHRRPRALPLAALFALPFRLPISTGGSTSNLLIPLYLVVGAGALAYAIPRLAGRASAADSEQPAPILLERLLAASVVLYAVQAVYSADFTKALENTVFFYVPFALLFALLREVKWTKELLLQCLGAAVALAVLFAGVGFVEYDRKQLFLNPKVVAANEYGNYFRVNSLFFDPNIYGRFLALVAAATTAGVMWSVRRREVLAGGAVLLWLTAGMVTSLSQSSIAALLLALAVIAAWRWDVRGTIYTVVALAAIGAVVALVAPPSAHLGLTGKGGSASNATSGRTKLVEGGLRLFADRPLQGYGPGSFAKEYREHEHVTAAGATSASHTIPVTVAAEQGIVGLALYAALLVVAFGVLFKGAGRSPARVAVAACFAALVLHTFVYADFLEDPETWLLLGIGVALARPPGVVAPRSRAELRTEPALLRS